MRLALQIKFILLMIDYSSMFLIYVFLALITYHRNLQNVDTIGFKIATLYKFGMHRPTKPHIGLPWRNFSLSCDLFRRLY